MSKDQDAFILRLRRQREERGVTLKAIAESTKIKESLLAALERGDVSQWPQGLYRRAYLRHYGSAIGLPAQSLVSEFVRLFPDEHDVADVREIAKSRHNSLAELPVASRLNHARAAIFDLAVVCLLCGLLGGLTDSTLWAIVGAVALGYCTLGTVCFGQSMGTFVLGRTDRLIRRMPDGRPSNARGREPLSIVQGRQRRPDAQRTPAESPERAPRRVSA